MNVRGRTGVARGRAAAVFLLTVFGAVASAAPPVVESIYPAGGQRGTSVAVTVAGKLDPWPAQVWADTPGFKVEAGKAAGSFTVHVAKDAPVGPHLLRLYNADGASSLRCFVVGEGREQNEAEPNDEPSKANPGGELPVTINGQLEKGGDVDHYAVTLRAGQRLVASVMGRRLGSGIDPMLHVVDPAGTTVAYAQDGLGLDPVLEYRTTVGGTHLIRVSAFAFPPAADVKLAGGKDAVYRLSLTTGPYVRRAIPSGVRRGEKAAVRLAGWNLESDRMEVDATSAAPGARRITVAVPGGDGSLSLDVSDVAELGEGCAGTRPATVALPANITGTLAAPGEQDRFAFTAKKGDRYVFTGRGGTIGSPLDAVLRIEDAAGKQLATDDDAPGVNDPRFEWSAPADGTYTAIVSDLFGRGGEDYVYRLEAQPPTAGVTAAVTADAYALAPGKTAAVKLTVTRRDGHAAGLVAVATGLPPGVSATSAEVPAKGGEVALALTAAADAKPANVPFRVLLLGTDLAKPEGVRGVFEIKKDREKAGTQELVDSIADLWLTVTPPAPTTSPAKAAAAP